METFSAAPFIIRDNCISSPDQDHPHRVNRCVIRSESNEEPTPDHPLGQMVEEALHDGRIAVDGCLVTVTDEGIRVESLTTGVTGPAERLAS